MVSHDAFPAFSLEHNKTFPSNSSCYMFSAHEEQLIITTKIAVSIAAVVMCLVAIAAIVFLKQYRSIGHRLILYLMIIGFFHGVSVGLDVAPVHHNGYLVVVREGLNGMCAAVGFLFQVTVWQFMLCFSWIVTYLVLLAVFQYQANSKRHEIAGLVISLGLPLTFNWLPFIHNMYGLAGPWCWIRTTNKDCRSNIKIGVAYQFTLFYGPQALIILLGFVSFLVIVATICKRIFMEPRGSICNQRSPNQKALRESLPLLIYPLLYNFITSVMITNRIYYAVTTSRGERPYFPLWFAQTIADPLRVLFVPLAFLLHPRTIRNLLALARGRRESRRNSDSETAYHVPQEPSFSEVESLVIRSEMTRVARSNYKSIFESN